MRILKTIFTIIMLTATSLSQAGSDVTPIKAQSSYYVEMFGLADPAESALIARAEQIFDRVMSVTDTPLGLTPGLRIINSTGSPWAIALAEGIIVLSKAALDICYNGVPEDAGDARLAFVLGHELAHLTANDFWHQQIYLTLSGSDNQEALESARDLIRAAAGIQLNGKTEEWQNVVKRKELQADDAGFLFASLAGFRTDLLISDAKEKTDFLRYWVTQTRTLGDKLHLGPTERTSFLRNRFKAISTKTDFFMYGVKLAHFGQYEDAIYFFKEFQRSFPAHEVLNNLGYAHLQLAYKYMPEHSRNKYWLPAILENIPPLLAHRGLDANKTAKPVKLNLQRAIKYLQQATNVQPRNINSRINLATAYFYYGEFFKARAVVEEARSISPDSSSVQQLRALILYEQEKDIDMWPTATNILQDLSAKGVKSATYNFARLLEERGRHKIAEGIWHSLIADNTNIPERYRQEACTHSNTSSQANCNSVKSQPQPSLTPNTRQLLGGDIDSKQVKPMLAKWQRHHREFGPIPIDVYIAENGDSYLALDYTLSLGTLKNTALNNKDDLIECCGSPQSTYKFGTQVIWSYGKNWSALLSNDQVLEVWVASLQEK